jgi:hypothetical protein
MPCRPALRCAAWCIAAWSAVAGATTLEVTDRGCARGVELLAQDAPLAAVLERLATTLGFRIDVVGELTGTVRMHSVAPAHKLLEELLSTQQGHVVWHARDPRCPANLRVTRVRLVAGPPGERPTPPLAAAPVVAHPAETTPAVVNATQQTPVSEVASPERLREVERESQQRRAEYEAYVRQHGVAPPGVEEDAAKP